MATLRQVIKAAVAAYRDEDGDGVDMSMTVEQLVQAAHRNDFSDTLLCFVVNQLYEGLDGPDDDEEVDLDRAVQLIDKGTTELQAVTRALRVMRPEHELYVRSRCCSGAWALVWRNGEYSLECEECGEPVDPSMVVVGPDLSEARCETCGGSGTPPSDDRPEVESTEDV